MLFWASWINVCRDIIINWILFSAPTAEILHSGCNQKTTFPYDLKKQACQCVSRNPLRIKLLVRTPFSSIGLGGIWDERDIIVWLWMIKAAPLPCYEGNQQVKIGELTKLNQSHQAK
jgi:hypothetical protein